MHLAFQVQESVFLAPFCCVDFIVVPEPNYPASIRHLSTWRSTIAALSPGLALGYLSNSQTRITCLSAPV
jgi:hypothetical protein